MCVAPSEPRITTAVFFRLSSTKHLSIRALRWTHQGNGAPRPQTTTAISSGASVTVWRHTVAHFRDQGRGRGWGGWREGEGVNLPNFGQLSPYLCWHLQNSWCIARHRGTLKFSNFPWGARFRTLPPNLRMHWCTGVSAYFMQKL